MSPALEAQCLNHWTTREVPHLCSSDVSHVLSTLQKETMSSLRAGVSPCKILHLPWAVGRAEQLLQKQGLGLNFLARRTDEKSHGLRRSAREGGRAEGSRGHKYSAHNGG